MNKPEKPVALGRKQLPLHLRKVLGDLSETERVIGLSLIPKPDSD